MARFWVTLLELVPCALCKSARCITSCLAHRNCSKELPRSCSSSLKSAITTLAYRVVLSVLQPKNRCGRTKTETSWIRSPRSRQLARAVLPGPGLALNIKQSHAHTSTQHTRICTYTALHRHSEGTRSTLMHTHTSAQHCKRLQAYGHSTLAN